MTDLLPFGLFEAPVLAGVLLRDEPMLVLC